MENNTVIPCRQERSVVWEATSLGWSHNAISLSLSLSLPHPISFFSILQKELLLLKAIYSIVCGPHKNISVHSLCQHPLCNIK